MQQYTAEQVAQHNTDNDCWCIINDVVVDITKFLDEHPGGKAVLTMFAGKDATEDFNTMHEKDYVEKYVKEGIKGTLKGSAKL